MLKGTEISSFMTERLPVMRLDEGVGTFYVFLGSRSIPKWGSVAERYFQLFLHDQRNGLVVSHRARVERGSSEGARSASTEDYQPPSLPLGLRLRHEFANRLEDDPSLRSQFVTSNFISRGTARLFSQP